MGNAQVEATVGTQAGPSSITILPRSFRSSPKGIASQRSSWRARSFRRQNNPPRKLPTLSPTPPPMMARPRSQDEIWLVAEVDGRVVGNLSAELQRPIETAARQLLRFLGETRLFVSALGVEQAYQRRGVATRLMEAVEQWGRDRGAVSVSLDTWIHSEQSVPFYERRMGYRRASIIFEKRLDSGR